MPQLPDIAFSNNQKQPASTMADPKSEPNSNIDW